MNEKLKYLNIRNNQIAYKQYHSVKNSHLPGIVFLHGFRSDMYGDKVIFLERKCLENDISFLAFDNLGHGKSSGNFIDQTMGTWKNTACSVIASLTNSPQIIVGSSMGGWIMLLITLVIPDKIHSLIGIAAAPDFTEELLWNQYSDEQKLEIIKKGIITRQTEHSTTSYELKYNFIEEARKHLVLSLPLSINRPMHLLHGMSDRDVPYETSIRLANHVTDDDVLLYLIKDGNHRLSRPCDLDLLWNILIQYIGI